jgi:hypothetical protein
VERQGPYKRSAKTRERLAAINYLKHINLCEPLLVNQLRFTLKRLDSAEFGWKADRVLAMLDSVFPAKSRVSWADWRDEMLTKAVFC